METDVEPFDRSFGVPEFKPLVPQNPCDPEIELRNRQKLVKILAGIHNKFANCGMEKSMKITEKHMQTRDCTEDQLKKAHGKTFTFQTTYNVNENGAQKDVERLQNEIDKRVVEKEIIENASGVGASPNLVGALLSIVPNVVKADGGEKKPHKRPNPIRTTPSILSNMMPKKIEQKKQQEQEEEEEEVEVISSGVITQNEPEDQNEDCENIAEDIEQMLDIQHENTTDSILDEAMENPEEYEEEEEEGQTVVPNEAPIIAPQVSNADILIVEISECGGCNSELPEPIPDMCPKCGAQLKETEETTQDQTVIVKNICEWCNKDICLELQNYVHPVSGVESKLCCQCWHSDPANRQDGSVALCEPCEKAHYTCKLCKEDTCDKLNYNYVQEGVWACCKCGEYEDKCTTCADFLANNHETEASDLAEGNDGTPIDESTNVEQPANVANECFEPLEQTIDECFKHYLNVLLLEFDQQNARELIASMSGDNGTMKCLHYSFCEVELVRNILQNSLENYYNQIGVKDNVMSKKILVVLSNMAKASKTVLIQDKINSVKCFITGQDIRKGQGWSLSLMQEGKNKGPTTYCLDSNWATVFQCFYSLRNWETHCTSELLRMKEKSEGADILTNENVRSLLNEFLEYTSGIYNHFAGISNVQEKMRKYITEPNWYTARTKKRKNTSNGKTTKKRAPATKKAKTSTPQKPKVVRAPTKAPLNKPKTIGPPQVKANEKKTKS